MEIRNSKKKEKVAFQELKSGDAFYYNSLLYMKINEKSTPPFLGANCVNLENGLMKSCPDSDVSVWQEFTS